VALTVSFGQPQRHDYFLSSCETTTPDVDRAASGARAGQSGADLTTMVPPADWW
jgi:hypothetical protein